MKLVIDTSVIIAVLANEPIKFVDVELEESLLIADKLNIYAYDAYLIACSIKNHCSLISLDNGLIKAAKNFGVNTVEIEQ